MSEQTQTIDFPYFEIKGTVKITEGNQCEFVLDPSITIPEKEGIQPFIGEFILEDSGHTYRRIDLFAVENSLTEEDIKARFETKGETAKDYLINIEQITFIRKDFLVD